MKRIIITGAIILSSLFSLNAVAQMSDEDAAKAVANRQAVFKLLSFSNGPIGQMARGNQEFDLDTALEAARRVEMLAGMIPGLFADDTSGNDVTTRAVDSIWADGNFADLAQNLANGAAEAIEILSTQGEDGLRAVGPLIGRNCGACHDAYRTD